MNNFLLDPLNSRSREHMFTCRIQYDLMEAAARGGYALRTYLPSVDRDGFDIIFDDRKTLIPTQLKTNASKTNNWKISRKFFRPTLENMPAYRLQSPAYGEGFGGGVIIIAIENINDSIKIEYSYCDFLILHLFHYKILDSSPKNSRSIENTIYSTIADTDGNFSLPRIAFIPAKTPQHLLSLMGLQSKINNFWRHEFLDFLRIKNIPDYISSWSKSPDSFEKEIKKTINSIGYI